MTTFVEARDAIVTLLHNALQTQHPTLEVFWENTLSIDLDTVGSPFVRIEIEFDDARQLTINGNPEHRTYGTVYFTIFVKEGEGTRDVYTLFQSITDIVKFQVSNRYIFDVPTPGRRDAQAGWRSYEMRTLFWFDSLV